VKNFISIWLILSLNLSLISGQLISEIDRDGLVSLTDQSDDTTYVINFWATWCAPCIKETAYFEELHREFTDSMLKVVLVSLDFPGEVENRLVPFLHDQGITAQVRIMTDLNYNDWIELVDPGWSGAIPATLIFNEKKRLFLEGELSKAELFEYVHQILN
jgi:thiol-disulfide isomerase/thioredoxin